MSNWFFLWVIVSLCLKLTIGAILQEENFNSNDNTFNGTLTEDYLLQLGYTYETTEIRLINHNITSIAPFTFVNFTKLDTLNLFYNKIEQINATTFKGEFIHCCYYSKKKSLL